MSVMKELMEQYDEMIGLLAGVLADIEYDGEVTPPTYLNIRKFMKDESSINDKMENKIEVWEDLNDCKLR